MVTLGTIATSPGPAPISGAISSPTLMGMSHQPCAHARTPRVAHSSAYAPSCSGTARGIAPNEFETRYVVVERIGNSSRKRRRSSSFIPLLLSYHGNRGRAFSGDHVQQ